MLILLTVFHTLHYFLAEFNRFPEFSRTSGLFPGLFSPRKCLNKISGLSRFSRTRTNPASGIGVCHGISSQRNYCRACDASWGKSIRNFARQIKIVAPLWQRFEHVHHDQESRFWGFSQSENSVLTFLELFKLPFRILELRYIPGNDLCLCVYVLLNSCLSNCSLSWCATICSPSNWR